MATRMEPWAEEFPLPVITPAADIKLEQERRCRDDLVPDDRNPGDVAGDLAGRFHRPDPRSADLTATTLIQGGQGRSVNATALSAAIVAVALVGLALVGLALLGWKCVRFVLS